ARGAQARRAYLGRGPARKRGLLLLHRRAGRVSGLPLRVLVLEDEPADAELELAALAEGGFDCAATLAESRVAFENAFAQGRFDLVLADYRLSGYTGLEAL